MTTGIDNVGKYEVLAPLAQGGMARIFLARQPGIGGFSRRVVLKCILPALAVERRFVHMFMEEARLASLIQHPNVVQIFDVGQESGVYYIAMELIDGLTVGTILTMPGLGRRVLDIGVAGEIVAQACSGLHSAHKLESEEGTPLNLVHRDISPQNLMVTSDGVVKLVDFGIAKAKGSAVTTQSGTVKGKFAYMSPEQVQAKPIDRRSDIFSLATVFFELITGEPLFERNTEMETMRAVVVDPVRSAIEVDSSIPRPISDFILQALHRDPEQRFPTAADMGRRLRRLLGELGHNTSPELLADFLEFECHEQLAEQRQKLTVPGQSAPPQPAPRAVADFGEEKSGPIELIDGSPEAWAPTAADAEVPAPEALEPPPTLPIAADPSAASARPDGVEGYEASPEELRDDGDAIVALPSPSLEFQPDANGEPLPELPRPDPARARRRPTGRPPGSTGSGGRPLLWIGLGVVALLFAAAVLAAVLFRERDERPAGPPLYFAHGPGYSSERIADAYEPLARYLERRTKRPVEVIRSPDHATLIDGLLSGEVHLARLSSLVLVQARARQPDLVLLAAQAVEGGEKVQSYIIARDGLGIRAVEQLQGRRFCHPGEGSTTGYLLPRRHVRSRGLDPDGDFFASTIASQGQVGVMTDIVAGRCDAGAVVSTAWFAATKLGIETERIRLVTAAGDAPPDVICASPKLSPALTETFRRALLELRPAADLGDSPPSPLLPVGPFAKVRLEDYSVIEEAARAEGLLD